MQRIHLSNSGKSIDMKRYVVEIMDEVLAEMEQLYNHIAYVRQAPENAKNQYNRIADTILTLNTLARAL